MLELFGQRRFAAANRPEQVEDLLAFFEPLSGVLEVGDDLFDRVLHTVELPEGRVHLDDLVHKDAREAGVVTRVHHLRLTDRHQEAFGRARVRSRVGLTQLQVLLDTQDLLAAFFVTCRITCKKRHDIPPSVYMTPIGLG